MTALLFAAPTRATIAEGDGPAADIAERVDDDRVMPAVGERWAGQYGIDAFA